MITIFISKGRTSTITPFLESWPNRAAASIRLFPYEHLHRIQRVDPGLFIFSDIDQLDAKQRQTTLHLYRYITQQYGEDLVLNCPARVLTRYPLLARLWENGINRFRVFPVTERSAPMRFPVFVRRIHDHKGPLTSLITRTEELDEKLNALHSSREDPDDLLIVEFCDTRGANAQYRKYSAFRIGDRIIPAHVFFSKDWMVKHNPPEPLSREEYSYIRDNPHRKALLEIFRLANIEYGRIDYGLLDGKIQVWEINTNPVIIQQRDNYAEDKLPIKQHLVYALADAFLSAALRADNLMAKEKRAIGILPPFPRLSPLHRLDRLLHAASL